MPRTDLPAFAAADRLPGQWAAEPRHFATYPEQFPPLEEVWDEAHLDWAIGAFVLPRVAFLHGPQHQRLVVADRPLRQDQFLVDALYPQGFPDRPWPTVDIPNGVATSRAARPRSRHPRTSAAAAYHAAVQEMRLVLVTESVQRMEQTNDRWGREAPYHLRGQSTLGPGDELALPQAPYDAQIWRHFTTILLQGT